jgi:transcriptional regulator with XRE-family HTH domain
VGRDIALKIGRNIAAARKATGRTQAEVAEKVGIETVSLSRIERGIVTPGIPTLDRIARELGVALGQLFEGASASSISLADNFASALVPLNQANRLFLLEQFHVWAEKLSEKSS